MPEDSKKSHQKGKNEPKEQRRKRQPRQTVTPVNKNSDKDSETKVPVGGTSAPPVYEPPPEFYQNLKRETDDILKITEETNAKYQKKEIQSNWAKYEMPIESYEEIDERENLGADYQALIDASSCVGGHFQFKHEKSWDVSTGPSPYDKYFDINMENLNIALSSIPFYDRNSLDLSLFNESDIQNMDYRATKYKQKYYNNKDFTSPVEKTLNILLNSDEIENAVEKDDLLNDNAVEKDDSLNDNAKCEEPPVNEYISNDFSKESVIQPLQPVDTDSSKKYEELNLDEDDLLDIVDNKDNKTRDENMQHSDINLSSKEIDLITEENCQEKIIKPGSPGIDNNSISVNKEHKNSIIESPEDLEKWLDDFLDG